MPSASARKRQKTNWPCALCGLSCGVGSLACDKCKCWTHAKCDSLTIDDLKTISGQYPYECRVCSRTADGGVYNYESAINRLNTDYDNVAVLSYRLSDGCIHYYDSQTVQKTASESLSSASSVSQAMQSCSDLIPNVYEGGLKIWECAIDLLEFLHNTEISFVGKSVLELGCGAGLPGILAAKLGAVHVHFQDYNSEVLEFYTIANVRLNQIEESGKCTCRYFSGDWSSFQQQSHSILGETFRYDIILTPETIYKTENYNKLVSVFESCLAEDGIVYLAAKSNYFGVGGGTRDFEQFVKKQGQFASEVCHTIDAGVPREIIKLTRQNKGR